MVFGQGQKELKLPNGGYGVMAAQRAVAALVRIRIPLTPLKQKQPHGLFSFGKIL